MRYQEKRPRWKKNNNIYIYIYIYSIQKQFWIRRLCFSLSNVIRLYVQPTAIGVKTRESSGLLKKSLFKHPSRAITSLFPMFCGLRLIWKCQKKYIFTLEFIDISHNSVLLSVIEIFQKTAWSFAQGCNCVSCPLLLVFFTHRFSLFVFFSNSVCLIMCSFSWVASDKKWGHWRSQFQTKTPHYSLNIQPNSPQLWCWLTKMSLSMPPNAARNWGKNTNFIWERKFCGILTAKNISGGRSTGTGSRQPGDALEFVSSRPVVSELYLHSARVFTQPGPSSVLSSCFPLITPGPPVASLAWFFCLFVCFCCPTLPPTLPPPHPQSSSGTFKKIYAHLK